ncbi:ArsR family transcriptional regulator [Halosegnis sp.]|uniref:DUF7347 domain-containing protein n=1 Tax=Halosegnis sp. TaxID=2864959 RepID=UPI0035D4A8FF
MSDDGFDGALAALTHEIRVDVLRALAEADEPLSYTRLRERVGVRDSGRFNYHLTQLCDHYVRETAAGYTLNHRGSRLVVVAGDGPQVERTDESAGLCPVCGEPDCERLVHVHLDRPFRG